jgi:CubicO group peptidase (beta-lactamase class C family)
LAPLLVVAQQASRFAAVAPRMQEFVDKGEAAGSVTLIATKDRIIHLSAVGKTDMAKDRKMRTDDIFWIASMSKPITAVCIAILDVLGRVVEAASGMPFDQFLQKRVLDPLGMKDTSFWIAPEKESRWAHPYRWNAPAAKLEETTISYLYKTAVTDRQRPPLGGAGLFSTAEDVARFYQMMLNQGALNGKRIFKPETVAEMTRKQTGALDARPGMPWGLGFCVVEDPAKMAANSVLSPNSFGHGGAFSTGVIR